MCFPFLFRATLDSMATEINEDMKMAAATALANLTHEPVPK
jgi:malate dehydrogenase (oxaloacetate-decarboxylating)(NADP+)